MTLNISDAIKKAYEGLQTYQNLISMLDKPKAKADISFWGTRYITVEGYNGWYPIDGLVERVDLLVTENYEFSQGERAIGVRLTQCICSLEEESEMKLKGKWFWTKFCVFIREFHISCPRDVNMYDANSQYSYYTKNQYKDSFGKDPRTEPRFKNRSGGRPSIWLVH